MSVVTRETSSQMVLNLLKAKENVNVPLDCPAAKKPQQIVAAPPKHNNKQKVAYIHTHTHTLQLTSITNSCSPSIRGSTRSQLALAVGTLGRPVGARCRTAKTEQCTSVAPATAIRHTRLRPLQLVQSKGQPLCLRYDNTNPASRIILKHQLTNA